MAGQTGVTINVLNMVATEPLIFSRFSYCKPHIARRGVIQQMHCIVFALYTVSVPQARILLLLPDNEAQWFLEACSLMHVLDGRLRPNFRFYVHSGQASSIQPRHWNTIQKAK